MTVDPAIRPRAVIGGFVVVEVLGDLDGLWTVADGVDADGRPARIWVSTAAAAGEQEVREDVERLARLGAAPGIGDAPLAPLRAACAFRGRLVVVREHVAGPTLRDRLDAGPLEPAEAVDVLGAVAAAVEALETFGVPHAHLSPSAIVLPPRSGTRAVLQSYGFPPSPGPAELDPALEEHVHYLAPELAGGGRAGMAADVYALAAMLVECLTGRPLFPPDPPPDVLVAHRCEAPPRAAAAAGLPEELDDVLQVALSKRPEERQRSALDLIREASAAFAGDDAAVAAAEVREAPAEAPEEVPAEALAEVPPDALAEAAEKAPARSPAEAATAPKRRPAIPSLAALVPRRPSLAGLLHRRPLPSPRLRLALPSLPRLHHRPLPSPKLRLTAPPRAAVAALPALAVACGLGTAAIVHGGHDAASARPAAAAAQQAAVLRRAAVLAAVDRTMDRLQTQRADGRRALRGAGDHRDQAAAATALARSYDAARRALPPRSTLAAATPAPELATQLAGVQRAYRALAGTMRAQDQPAYERSRRLVLDRERRLEVTLGRLARQG